MPTAGKLIGSALMAVLTLLVSAQIARIMAAEEMGSAGMMVPINGLFGLILGWRILGERVGDGYRAATGYALTTFVAIFVFALVVWSGVEMLELATRGRYDGPSDALAGMGQLMLDYAIFVARPSVVILTVVGCYIVGTITESVAQRWP